MTISRDAYEWERRSSLTLKRLTAHLQNNDTFFNDLSLEKQSLSLEITDDVLAFFRAIEENNSVTCLRIFNNYPSRELIQLLILVLQKNQTITRFYFEEEHFTKHEMRAIRDILNRNREISIAKMVNPKIIPVDYDKFGTDELKERRLLNAAFRAAESGDVDLLYSLVHKNPDLLSQRRYTFSGDTLLHIASEFGHVDCVKVLLILGADVNFNCEDHTGIYMGSPLHTAVEENQIIIVQLLLEAGASAELSPQILTWG